MSFFELSSLLAKYTNLQHLRISIPTLIIPGAHIELPFLHTLSITIEALEDESEVPNPLLPSHIGVWNLPQLRYLEVDSVYANVWEIKLLHFLLTQVGRAITHFHLGEELLERYDVTKLHLFNDFWEAAVSLECLGVGISDFSKLSGPPESHDGIPVTIFLHMRNRWWLSRDQPREFIENLPKQWQPGLLGQVKLGVTWEDLRNWFNYDERRFGFQMGIWNGDVQILDVLHTTGHGLMDREGVAFDEVIRDSLVSVASLAKPRVVGD
ncbi:hypothetical protein M408DRAFT_25871 [Serendipita vermifera MAFF 305830]|uniref:Uncharacterized protein n=1 Tax=Serendipita vermifera MAFF 305830 TaxID=933852 RepID=A0A0C3AME0_SERVB|nr:hypothetical protein M408DRAFT_25871 [Serendipita vermifera MAFF 305830]